MLIEHRHSCFGRERIRLAVGAEHGKPAVLRQQPLAVRGQALAVRAQIGFERGDDGRQYAFDAVSGAHICFLLMDECEFDDKSYTSRDKPRR